MGKSVLEVFPVCYVCEEGDMGQLIYCLLCNVMPLVFVKKKYSNKEDLSEIL